MRKADILLGLIGPIMTAWLAIVLRPAQSQPRISVLFLYVCSSIAFPILPLRQQRLPVVLSGFLGNRSHLRFLALLALHEVFRKVFAAFYEKRWFGLFFPLVVIAISALAVIYRLGSPPAQANQVISLIISWEWPSIRSGSSLRPVLRAGLVQRHRLARISFRYCLGLCCNCYRDVYRQLGAFGIRNKIQPVSSYAPAMAYILAVILWLKTFLRPPEPEPQWRLKITPEQLLEEMRRVQRSWKDLEEKLDDRWIHSGVSGPILFCPPGLASHLPLPQSHRK